MSIEITPELESVVHGILAAGNYASEADVIAEALNLLQKREQLRVSLQHARDKIERGERLSADEVFGPLHRRAAEIDGRDA